jgi:hypothetical protein
MSTTTTDPARNGHSTDAPTLERTLATRDREVSAFLDEKIAELRDMLDVELEGRTELEALLDASKARERRITRALAVLEDQPLNNHAPKQAAPAAAKPRDRKNENEWRVSEPTIERVLDAFTRYSVEHPAEPFTMTVLAAWMKEHGEGVGGETVRKAVHTLRDRGLVRACGTTRGGGTLYALMPSHGELEAS